MGFRLEGSYSRNARLEQASKVIENKKVREIYKVQGESSPSVQALPSRF